MLPTENQTTLPLSNGIDVAVRKAGSQTALAEQLKSRFPSKPHPSQQAVSQWVKRGYVPPSRAPEIAAVSGVPVADLLSPALRDILRV